MSVVNFAAKELTLKIVYYGPGLGGKTTNLQSLHNKLNPSSRSKMLSLATAADRTLFFDFMPVSIGKVNGYTVKIQLYTVPGQVYYNATRKLVLKGADAVVFVASSQKSMRQENIDSLKNMWENLSANNLDYKSMPTVIQYNKRDLPDIDSVSELNSYLNIKNYPFSEGIAVEGIGVKETFKMVTKLLLSDTHQKYEAKSVRTSKQVNKYTQTSSDKEDCPQQVPQPKKNIPSSLPPEQSISEKVNKRKAYASEIKNNLQLDEPSSTVLTSKEQDIEKKNFIVTFMEFIKKIIGKSS